jgi:hypothetical protein
LGNRFRPTMKKFLDNVGGRAWLEGDPSKDCTVGLVVFGTLEILPGIFCFPLAMLLLMGVSTIGLHGLKSIHYGMAMGFLFYLTGWFIIRDWAASRHSGGHGRCCWLARGAPSFLLH